MIEISLIVWINNIICVLVMLSCFIHALHSGIYTNGLTKCALYFMGIAYLGSIIDVKQVVLPGYLAIMFANIFVGIIMILAFLFEANRSGYLPQWIASISRFLHFLIGNDNHVRSKK